MPRCFNVSGASECVARLDLVHRDATGVCAYHLCTKATEKQVQWTNGERELAKVSSGLN